jgi:hypothetical protein
MVIKKRRRDIAMKGSLLGRKYAQQKSQAAGCRTATGSRSSQGTPTARWQCRARTSAAKVPYAREGAFVLLPVFSGVVEEYSGISLREIAYVQLIQPPDAFRLLP